ncbi:MAG: hypothetical protein ABIF87_12770 [Pseudomonadota bacterium]
MFEELIKKTGLSRDMVEASLEAAIEESLYNCLGIYDCDIDLKERTAVGVFRVSQDISIEEALVFNKGVVGQDIVTVRFDFASFPKRVVRQCSEIFPRVLLDMEASVKYKEWRAKRRSVTEGVVIDRTGNEVTLDLGSQPGFLLREEWVLSEAEKRYRNGRPMFVYVLRVERDRSAVNVYVSRQSINLPVALMKREIPWHRFAPVWRKAGHKCVIATDSSLDDKTLKAARKNVGKELGERVILTGFFKKQPPEIRKGTAQLVT